MNHDHAKLGEPTKLRQDCLPTQRDVYNHYLHLREIKQKSGEWQHNTPQLEQVRALLDDVKRQWDKTQIPHTLEGRKGEKLIINLLTKTKSLVKIQLNRRDEEFGKELDQLFDVSYCSHLNYPCMCPADHQV